MRCDQCNKFVAYDTGTDPEVDIDVDDEGHVTGTVRIVLTCAECSQELKEYTFEVDANLDEEHKHNDVDFSADASAVELTSRQDCGKNRKTGKPNKYNPRYAVTYYGYTATVTVSCSCGKFQADTELADEVRASSMDELV